MNACDYGHFVSGETRRVPWQPGVENSGASIVCRLHHQQIAREKDDCPTWESCEVVGEVDEPITTEVAHNLRFKRCLQLPLRVYEDDRITQLAIQQAGLLAELQSLDEELMRISKEDGDE